MAEIAEGVLFRPGDVTANADAAEEGAESAPAAGSDSSLGIGSLRSTGPA